MDFGQILAGLGSAMKQGGGFQGGGSGMGSFGLRQPQQQNPMSYGFEEEEKKPMTLLDLLMRYDQDVTQRMMPNNNDPNANWLTKFGGY